MTNQNAGDGSFCGLSRRSLLQSSAALLSLPLIAQITSAWAQETLAGSGEVVAFTWGGSYTEGVRRYVFEPFKQATGIKVVEAVGDLPVPLVKAMHHAGRVDWDIAYLPRKNYPEMHEAGMFVPIDYSLWDQESLDGTPPEARLKDAVYIDHNSEVLAYDPRAFPDGGPQTWVDFWDVKKFPGPRGLYASRGQNNIRYALIASGFTKKDMWPLTDDKLDIAFKKLNEIKPHISKWWSAGGEPAQLLINREYAVTSIYDGRAIAAIRQGASIKFSWEGAHVGPTLGVVLKGGPNTNNAQKLLAFLNRAQIAAGFTQATGYPGPNSNQLKYLPPDLAPLLSINPVNASKFIIDDFAWLQTKRADGKTNEDYIQERWLAWRAA
ncbi:extracellular solute-binding protein [Bradyrhizobium yuanmingense]|uniref:ABC transporter substrate-binding protein n=1 Tax=Bradyrhizobium yuanmingense TaxID=108015 RepID=UPI0012F791AA|nr:ABC transporter substrate-binding protein [Bradyrhizobium yuanmingense]MVT55251.1 extracellular solute-binding protein [Bradyrhizobium yuanmingense]